jgi:hypothetical protein
MTTDSRRRGAWWVGIGLGVVALLGALLVLRDPAEYYSPARGTLSEAELRLGESYRHETEVLQELQEAHQELRAAIGLLETAEIENPNRKLEIAEIRSRLQQLEDDQKTQRMTPAELKQTYLDLLRQLETVIRKH